MDHHWTNIDPDDRAEVLRLIRELAGKHAGRPGGRILARAILSAAHLLEDEAKIALYADAAE